MLLKYLFSKKIQILQLTVPSLVAGLIQRLGRCVDSEEGLVLVMMCHTSLQLTRNYTTPHKEPRKMALQAEPCVWVNRRWIDLYEGRISAQKQSLDLVLRRGCAVERSSEYCCVWRWTSSCTVDRRKWQLFWKLNADKVLLYINSSSGGWISL